MGWKIIKTMIVIVGVMVASCKQSDTPMGGFYRVYVTDSEIVYISNNTGLVIYRETFPLNGKVSELQHVLINNKNK